MTDRSALLAGLAQGVLAAAVAYFIHPLASAPAGLLMAGTVAGWGNVGRAAATAVRLPLAAVPAVGGLSEARLPLHVVALLMALSFLVRGGVTLPTIDLPNWTWPKIVLPDLTPDPTGPLTAVVVYETTEPILASERDALYSADVTAYVASHFAKRDEHPEWRAWDDGETDLSEESGELQSAYATAVQDAAGKWPWIAIRRDGKPVFSGELPDDEAAVLSLLKTYGGE